MSENESREERSNRHEREVEDSQQGLRDSISQTQNLLDESDKMLKRHRQEDGDAEK